ncbi:FtsQ-type POTRA domain-containing protein [Lachnospiraceae bacterium 46-15]
MKEITTYGKKRRRIGKIIGALAGIAVLAALVVFGLFRVRHMKVSGNSIYSSTDIQNAVMQDGLCKNTLYLMWKYKDDSRVEEELPFLSSVEVEMISPSEVEIRVYEKPEVGYFLNGTDYVYFDRDGLIVEISKKLRENIPKITGVTIAKPVRYEKIPVRAGSVPETGSKKETEEAETGSEKSTEASGMTAEEAANQEVFDAIVDIAQILNKNELVPKEIKFDKKQEITLYFENMRVKLGKNMDMEDKLMVLKSVYEKVEKKEGVLHMEGYSSDSQTVTFKKGETEETLEVEKPKKPGEDEPETEKESESEPENGAVGMGAVYSESDGTFSTDADGTPIYTDKNGNTTPNVDSYQYTDENGKVITDGYGYIDPYTGAYILK